MLPNKYVYPCRWSCDLNTSLSDRFDHFVDRTRLHIRLPHQLCRYLVLFPYVDIVRKSHSYSFRVKISRKKILYNGPHCPLKLPLHVDLYPRFIRGSMDPLESILQGHIDRFSRFAGLTIVTDRQTNRQTDRPRCFVCNNRQHLGLRSKLLRCGLIMFNLL